MAVAVDRSVLKMPAGLPMTHVKDVPEALLGTHAADAQMLWWDHSVDMTMPSACVSYPSSLNHGLSTLDPLSSQPGMNQWQVMSAPCWQSGSEMVFVPAWIEDRGSHMWQPLGVTEQASAQVVSGEVEQDRQVGGNARTQRKQRRAKKQKVPFAPDACNSVDNTLTSEELSDQASLLAENLLGVLRAGRVSEALQRFADMAFRDNVPSRAAQLALELATPAEQISLSSAFSGKVLSASQDKFANYVLQKMVEVMPFARISFIVQELIGHGGKTARHCIGCRIMCRLLEHAVLTDEGIACLVDDILMGPGITALCTHDYGRHVVVHLLEYGLPCHRERILGAISVNLCEHVHHRKSSHIVEAALKFCSTPHQRLLANSLLAEDHILSFATGQFSRHVMVALLRHPSADIRRQAHDALLPIKERLSVGPGKLVLRELLPMVDTASKESSDCSDILATPSRL
jgi:hypothetical protein